MLTSTLWIGGSGLWSQAANWSNGVPTSSVAATISPSAAATITVEPGEADAAASLTLGSNAALSMPGSGNPTNPTSNWITANAGFESPAAKNGSTPAATWGYWGSAYVSTQYAYSGSQSLVLSGNNSGIGQSFIVTPGDSYTASVYAMTPAGNPLTGSLNGQLQVLFYDSSGNQISGYTAPNQIEVLTSSSASGGPLAGSVGNQGWNHYFTTVIAPSNAVKVGVQLSTWATSSTYGGTVYFDAVQFGPAATGGSSSLTVGSLVNNGSITIGPMNHITVSGSFTQGSTGTLDAQLGGAPSTGIYGSLTITGAASLAGTLKTDLVYGYAPSTTDSFTPISYASESGGFAAYTLPSGAGYQLAAAASFTNVSLSAAPSAATTTTVNAGSVLRSVSASLLGINVDWWDQAAVTAQTRQMVTAAGMNLYRFPGGSSSDDFHFNVQDTSGDSAAIAIPQFAQFIAAFGGTGLVTLDYGSGSPQEAAAELAYLLGSPSDTTVIGDGLEWNDSTGQWQTVNWGTAGYWASLRAASPLAKNDGLNFLRIDHSAPFSSIKYWEVGNEEYGSWEIDHHGTNAPGGVSTGAQHDPATYVAFAQQFAALAATILANAGLPAISIGIDSGDPTGYSDNDWTENVLAIGKANGFVPSFISDHSYMQAPDAESDSFLLNDTVADAGSNLDWSTRYGLYESMLQQTLGSQASSVALMATEFNSVYSDPGKQSTSLVNGLFVANSLGSLLDSGYTAASIWDLRNGGDSTNNDSNLLYGWRTAGDYGVLGPYGENDPPASSTYVAYPSYFALQLASKIIVAGGQVVSAASNYGDLDVYAVRESDGDLDLLVLNTNPAAAITSQFDLTGFQPSGVAQVWQYGKAQDTAQSLSSNGSASLSDSSAMLSLSGADFSYSFPSYSMTVLDLSGNQTLTVGSGTLVVSSPNSLSNGLNLAVGANVGLFGAVTAAGDSSTTTTAAYAAVAGRGHAPPSGAASSAAPHLAADAIWLDFSPSAPASAAQDGPRTVAPEALDVALAAYSGQ